PELLDKLRKIDRYHVEQFTYLLRRLQSVKEGECTLLDHCMVLYGGGLADGNAHDHDNLPIILAGKAGRTIRPGRHIRTEKETPLNNLFLSMLDRIGVHAERFGDSTGRLAGLEG